MELADSSTRYGQSILCVSASTDELDAVAEAYLIDGVNVYNGNMGASL